jgi:hypothetical protein
MRGRNTEEEQRPNFNGETAITASNRLPLLVQCGITAAHTLTQIIITLTAIERNISHCLRRKLNVSKKQAKKSNHNFWAI